MSSIDRAAIQTFGIPRLLLMEHAGLALARCAITLVSEPSKPILVCCGTGFNGGDGLAAARHLYNQGHSLRVVLAGDRAQVREEPATYVTMVERLGIPVKQCPSIEAIKQVESWMGECGLIIDALLGIGIRGSVREPMASLIGRMNRSGKPIVAADLPSGLDADRGLPQGIAIQATMTVAFGLPKQGCFLRDGPAYTGTLVVDSITIPPMLLETGKDR